MSNVNPLSVVFVEKVVSFWRDKYSFKIEAECQVFTAPAIHYSLISILKAVSTKNKFDKTNIPLQTFVRNEW